MFRLDKCSKFGVSTPSKIFLMILQDDSDKKNHISANGNDLKLKLYDSRSEKYLTS